MGMYSNWDPIQSMLYPSVQREEEEAMRRAKMFQEMAQKYSSDSIQAKSFERQARSAMEDPSRGRMMRFYNTPGNNMREGVDPITWRPKDEVIANKGNYWADLLVSIWKGNPAPDYMNYIPRTPVQDTPNMSFSPMGEESKDAAGNAIETSSIQFDPRQRRVPYAEYERRKQAAAGPEPSPYSVIRGSDVNVMGGAPPEQAGGGDEQALQEILSQDEYNPASGMTYQEWLEWKMANSRSLGALGKITGARMPRTGQRR